MDYSQYLKVNARNYTDISAVCKDIAKLCKTYKGKFGKKCEFFIFNKNAGKTCNFDLKNIIFRTTSKNRNIYTQQWQSTESYQFNWNYSCVLQGSTVRVLFHFSHSLIAKSLTSL